MAKKKVVVKLPTKSYYVASNVEGRKLGPYDVREVNGQRVVTLNEKQAKYYLTTGAISEVAG